MRTRPAVLTLLAGLILAAGLIAGCGGDSGGSNGADADPQTVLDTALGSGGDPIESGVLDLSAGLASSSGSQVGSIEASLTGPFQSNGDGTLPSVDFTGKATGDAAGTSIDVEAGLTLTPDGLYVSYGGADYQVDDATFSLIKDSYAQSSQLQQDQADTGSLAQLGIDPESWLTDVTNEGTEDIDGTEVVHVSGTADVAKIVSDLGTAAEQTGQASQLNPADLSALKDSVQNATIDVYADADDDTLRKLDVSLDVADPAGGDGAATVTFSVGIADPNTEQTITAPADAQPIQGLLDQIPGGAAALGGLGGLSGASGSSGTGSAGVGATVPGGDAYYQCVAASKSAAEVEDCAKLLGG